MDNPKAVEKSVQPSPVPSPAALARRAMKPQMSLLEYADQKPKPSPEEKPEGLDREADIAWSVARFIQRSPESVLLPQFEIPDDVRAQITDILQSSASFMQPSEIVAEMFGTRRVHPQTYVEMKYEMRLLANEGTLARSEGGKYALTGIDATDEIHTNNKKARQVLKDKLNRADIQPHASHVRSVNKRDGSYGRRHPN